MDLTTENEFQPANNTQDDFDRATILAVLHDQRLKRRNATRGLRIGASIVTGVTLFGTAMVGIRHHELPVDMLLPIAILFAGGWSMGATQIHKIAAQAAAQLKDKRALGYLLEIMDAADAEITQMATETATELLLLLTEEDVDLLDTRQRAILFSQMRISKNTEFVPAAIAALRRMGGRDAVAVLEYIAVGNTIPLEKSQAVAWKNGATVALADLRIRLAKEIIDADMPRRAAVAELEAHLADGSAENRIVVESTPLTETDSLLRQRR